MRYRTAAVLVALTASVGLSVPAASASTGSSLLPASSCTVGQTTHKAHFLSNDNQSVGLTFTAVGSQATVTTSPGLTEGTCVISSPPTYEIHNSNGHCLRMRDSSHSYRVMEESTCDSKDSSQLWTLHVSQGGSIGAFWNRGAGRWLGTDCGVKNGWKVWGVPNTPGACLNWILENA